jgi:hypothetical protein
LEADPARPLELQRARRRAALASVWTKLAVIDWTERDVRLRPWPCRAIRRAAGAARATIATGASARAKRVGKVISNSWKFAPELAFAPLNAD